MLSNHITHGVLRSTVLGPEVMYDRENLLYSIYHNPVPTDDPVALSHLSSHKVSTHPPIIHYMLLQLSLSCVYSCIDDAMASCRYKVHDSPGELGNLRRLSSTALTLYGGKIALLLSFTKNSQGSDLDELDF